MNKIIIIAGVLAIAAIGMMAYALSPKPSKQIDNGLGVQGEIIQPYIFTTPTSTASATTTEWFGDINPQVTELYSLGTSTKQWKDLHVSGQICLAGTCESTWPSGGGISWEAFEFPPANNTYSIGSATGSLKNVYASGTIYGNMTWTRATGTHTTTTNLFATYGNITNLTGTSATWTQMIRSNGLMAGANNLYDIGSGLNSWANIYSSGTVSGVNGIFTGTVTSTNMEIGTFVSQPDAGLYTLVNSKISGTASGTWQGYQFDIADNAKLSIACLSDGVSDCASSSTGIFVYAPFVFPTTATTTVTTSTKLDPGVPRYMVMASSTLGLTTPFQIFTTSTADSTDGRTVELMGTSDTYPVTIATTAVDVNIGADCVLGDGDTITLRYSYWGNYWYSLGCVDN
jgi:hypothetical protein